MHMELNPRDYTTLSEVSEADLSRARQEMMTALDVFLKHIRYLMTLMTSILGAGYAVFTYSISNDSIPDQLAWGAVLMLVALSPLGHFSQAIVERYYKIYVSNYVYSARLHWITKRSHPWVNDLFNYPGINSECLFSDSSVEFFIKAKNPDEKHSWHFYQIMMSTFRYVGLISALGFALCIFLTV